MDTSRNYRVTNEIAQMDFAAIHDLLCNHSYWANGRTRQAVEESFQSPASINFGLLDGDGKTVGCARVVTDCETFGWVCDVIVHPSHRARGLGKMLVSAVVTHPKLAKIRLILGTRDAHTLYEKFGFERREMMRRPAPQPPT